MRLITKFAMASKIKDEFRVFLRKAFNELAMSEPNSPKRRKALASIENIQSELGMR